MFSADWFPAISCRGPPPVGTGRQLSQPAGYQWIRSASWTADLHDQLRLGFRRRSDAQGRVHRRGRLKGRSMLQKWPTPSGRSATKPTGRPSF